MTSTLTAADLYISGNVTAGGTVQANYADLAEYFLTKDTIACGDPVSITDLRTVGKYNGKSYAGVRSTIPGFSMGGEMGGGIPVALIGSVPVNTRDQSIRIGDKLVLTRSGKIVKKRWFHVFTQYVGISQDAYKDGQVMCLLGV